MLLHDTMNDAVADVAADLSGLAAASRRQGLSIRRRRRALSTVGAAAAATVLVAGTWTMLPGESEPKDTIRTDNPAVAVTAPLSGDTAPITDRGVAAALADTIVDVADGTVTRFQGDVYGIDGNLDEALGALLFLPATGTGPAGQVMINLQPLNVVGKPPYACEAEFMTDCAVRTLPSGDILRTYHDNGDTEFGADSQRAVAELLSPVRRLRIVVFALNTNPWDKGAYRDRAVLDIEQLIEIAKRPWWSRTELPREYVNAGSQLEDFS